MTADRPPPPSLSDLEATIAAQRAATDRLEDALHAKRTAKTILGTALDIALDMGIEAIPGGGPLREAGAAIARAALEEALKGAAA